MSMELPGNEYVNGRLVFMAAAIKLYPMYINGRSVFDRIVILKRDFGTVYSSRAQYL